MRPCSHTLCVWLPIIHKYTNIGFVPEQLCECFATVHEKFRKRTNFNLLTEFNSCHKELNGDLRQVEITIYCTKNGVIQKYKDGYYEKKEMIKIVEKIDKLKNVVNHRQKWNQRFNDFMRYVKKYRKGENISKTELSAQYVTSEMQDIYKIFFAILENYAKNTIELKMQFPSESSQFDNILQNINHVIVKHRDILQNIVDNVPNEKVPQITRNTNFPRIRQRDTLDWSENLNAIPRNTAETREYRLVGNPVWKRSCLHYDCAWKHAWELFTGIFDKTGKCPCDVPLEFCESLREISTQLNATA